MMMLLAIVMIAQCFRLRSHSTVITVEATLYCFFIIARRLMVISIKDRIIEVASLVTEPNDVPVSIASFSLLH